jgi:hypothetical protein
MKVTSLPSTIVNLFVILVNLFLISCVKDENKNNFVSHLIFTPQSMEQEFINYLYDESLPIWQNLKERNVIYELRVFKFNKIDSTTTDTTKCNFLILAQLAPQIDPHDFLKMENFIDDSLLKDTLEFQLIRTEILGCLPDAYFPSLSPKDPNEIDYWIEFIAVKDSSDYIEQYNNLMSKYFGPLNGELVKQGTLYNIYMMETKEIVTQTNDNLTWNQIHISGDFPEYRNINWDSLYTESFRNIFSCELDSVWTLLPPRLHSSFDCEGKLIQELYVK